MGFCALTSAIFRAPRFFAGLILVRASRRLCPSARRYVDSRASGHPAVIFRPGLETVIVMSLVRPAGGGLTSSRQAPNVTPRRPGQGRVAAPEPRAALSGEHDEECYHAGCGHVSKFKPAVLGEIQAVDDTSNRNSCKAIVAPVEALIPDSPNRNSETMSSTTPG
jgi:hypothetical protein